jgi:hypothetical protein
MRSRRCEMGQSCCICYEDAPGGVAFEESNCIYTWCQSCWGKYGVIPIKVRTGRILYLLQREEDDAPPLPTPEDLDEWLEKAKRIERAEAVEELIGAADVAVLAWEGAYTMDTMGDAIRALCDAVARVKGESA